MARSSSFLVALLSCLLICSVVQARLVTTLTTENFDKVTAQGKWIIDFFAPWCPHCQQLEPIFEESATAVSALVSGVRFGSVDCTAQPGLAERFNIEAYPTIKYYRRGVVSDYEGGREAPDFVAFAKQVTSPAVTKLKDSSELAKFRSVPVSFVLYYTQDQDLIAFTTIAEKYQDTMRFGVTKNDDMLKKLPSKAKVAIVWFNDGEPEYFGTDSDTLDASAAENWVLARKYAHFTPFDATSWKYFSDLQKPIVVGVLAESATATTLWRSLQQIALKNSDFAFGRLDGKRYENFVNTYTGGAASPTFFVIDPTRQLYWYNSTIGHKQGNLEAFLNAITKGEIEGSTATLSVMAQMGSFFSTLFGEVLDEPLILGLICVIFVVVVILAVWFISDSGEEVPSTQGQSGSSSTKPSSPKTTSSKVSVTIEKPEEDANRPNKVKKD